MMSFPVWLPGPMFLLGGLCPWSHVPSRVGVSVQGILCPGGSLSRGVSVWGCREISEIGKAGGMHPTGKIFVPMYFD